MSGYPNDMGAAAPRLGLIRIAIGLLAGAAIWALQEAAELALWPATAPGLFGALTAAALFTPFVLVGGLSAIRGRTLTIWSIATAVVFAGLGWHDLARGVREGGDPWLSPSLMGFGAAGLFIAHHLIAGADAERRFIARYPRYFEIASKHAVQLALSAAFTGAFWIVLRLGGALFDLIGIDAINELLNKEWFGIPATATVFAAAVHLTDVRVSLIRGIRTIALTLLSWLLPVLTVLGAAFLIALPFTGLDPLWRTRSATAILLGSAAVLIALINAAYQDGEPDGIVPLVLRLTARLAAALLAPLVILAAYALSLRIGQHGLTPDRIVGVACCMAGAVYAAGYLAAAVRPGRWIRWLEPTNVLAAFVVLGLLLAILTPVADPARLSVDNQMKRLAEGKVPAARFDYRFLRWGAGRYGREALTELRKKGGEAGREAERALAQTERRDSPAPTIDPADVPVVWPGGRTLPPAFFLQAWGGGEQRQCGRPDVCVAVFADVTRDGKEEVIVSSGSRVWVHSLVDGQWSLAAEGTTGVVLDQETEAFRKQLGEGAFTVAPPRIDDLVVDGRPVHLRPLPPKRGEVGVSVFGEPVEAD